jgi:hypothetical protein
VLYAPLYIAGPIMTFNDFLWQVLTIIALFSDILIIRRIFRFDGHRTLPRNQSFITFFDFWRAFSRWN